MTNIGKPFDFEGGEVMIHGHAASYQGDKDVYEFTLKGRAKITRENFEDAENCRIKVQP